MFKYISISVIASVRFVIKSRGDLFNFFSYLVYSYAFTIYLKYLLDLMTTIFMLSSDLRTDVRALLYANHLFSKVPS